MEIVLVHPEIPHNTGSAARLAAATGLRLNLIEPLGFSLEDRYLKRAGLDYWPMVDLCVHPDWEHAARVLGETSSLPLRKRLRLFSARGGTSLFQTAFEPDDLLVFGSESKGIPKALLSEFADRRVYVPIRNGIRSLNLASTVCLGAYTAMNVAGLPLPDNDGGYLAHPDAKAGLRPADIAQFSKDASLGNESAS